MRYIRFHVRLQHVPTPEPGTEKPLITIGGGKLFHGELSGENSKNIKSLPRDLKFLGIKGSASYLYIPETSPFFNICQLDWDDTWDDWLNLKADYAYMGAMAGIRRIMDPYMGYISRFARV